MQSFLCYIFEHGALSQEVPRLTPSIDKESKRVFLELSSAEVSDSAVYYCALVPTVTGTPTLLCKNLTHGERDESRANVITSLDSDKNVLEGAKVTLSCNYSGYIDSIQWYHQYLRSKPEFILFVTESNSTGEVPSRMSSYINKDKHVFLDISSAEVSDSALYYCALVPTYPNSIPEFLYYIFEHGTPSEEVPRLTPSIDKESKRVFLELSSAEVSDSAVYYCALVPTVTGTPTLLCKNLTHGERDESRANVITSLDSDKNVLEGAKVTLSCNYSGSIWSIQWYRQYRITKPEFILFVMESNSTGEVPSRMSSYINKDKHVFLEISSAEVSDSALYYCALVPTVTGNTQTCYKNIRT
ncbi:hypothetical protein ACEWY4_007066 [Coilia grayii]|uniref:Ig-like domain-containing protein n=1 Tax=Coilia grayii TaxID=363190 RepID=A0ABD1KF83_9TELE